MSELHAYGCSFTNYAWPTWADHFSSVFRRYTNNGLAGAGNSYIFNKFCQDHAQKQIRTTDTVAIMWSTIHRFDYYKDGRWINKGSVYNSHHTTFVKNYVDPVGYYIRDCAYIHAVKSILDSIGCRYIFFSTMPIGASEFTKYSIDTDGVQRYQRIYQNCLNTIKPSVFEIIYNSNWDSRLDELNTTDGKIDRHPTSDMHLEYLNTVLPDWRKWN